MLVLRSPLQINYTLTGTKVVSKGHPVVILFSPSQYAVEDEQKRPYALRRDKHQDKYMHDDNDNKVRSGLHHERTGQRQNFECFYLTICVPNYYGKRGNLCACIR